MTDKSAYAPEPVVVMVSGDFAFTRNRDFREVLLRYPKGQRAFQVDLAGVKALDSSALGMLLQLREHSIGGDGVTLINPSPAVRATLADAEAGRLFRVVEA